MKKIFLSAFILGGLALVGCQKPESIPAPTSDANLKIHFEGIINGSDVEWTKNVNGYKVESRKVTALNTTTGQLDLAYYCAMKSSSKVSAIEIGLGSIMQDPNLGTSPTMATMLAFMNSNLLPNYSDSAKVGFEVKYTDELGRLFKSDETQPGTVEFMDLETKEDNAGEYIQFKCTFTCPVFYKHPTDPTKDATGVIQNATLTGYFTR